MAILCATLRTPGVGRADPLPSRAEREENSVQSNVQTGLPPGAVDWNALVAKIQAGQPEGLEQLYALFSRGVRYYLCRQLGPQELEDKVHDTFLVVVQAIRRGELREPERLMGFVRTVVRRQVAAFIDRAVQNRKDYLDLDSGARIADIRQNPEERAILHQRAQLVSEVLRNISPRDREILTRFYILEQSQEQICSEMGLSETQFRLLKSRAKARFGELGRRRVLRTSLVSVLLRSKTSVEH